MSKIVVDNLRKTYGDTVALDDVSFEVPAGEFVIILGVSGSGKSTLLRCLSSLTTPTAGEVIVDGEPMVQPRPELAMIFQQHNIVGDMSAYSNALSGGINRCSFTESVLQLQDLEEKQRALEALDTVGLLEEAEQKARRMSGGQQQRVGIARALTQQPEVLLADEPVASLDPGSAQDVMQYLHHAANERELTTFISLHQSTSLESTASDLSVFTTARSLRRLSRRVDTRRYRQNLWRYRHGRHVRPNRRPD